MSALNWLGVGMVAVPALLFTVAITYDLGWCVVLVIFGGTAGVLMLVSVGSYLAGLPA